MAHRTVVVPEGCKAVFVSDQLAAQWDDWTPLVAPEPYTGIEARVYALDDDPDVFEVQVRYTGA